MVVVSQSFNQIGLSNVATGGSQNASKVLKEQKDAVKSQDGAKKRSSESEAKDKKKGTFQRALGKVLT